METRFPWETEPQPAPPRPDVLLNPVEIRILGCLVEKQTTTPETYPLTLNSLRLACNQTTNRDPITTHDAETIERAIESLRRKELIWVVRGGRATKFDHRFAESFKLERRELAVMCVLMLRGPQTPGEIRARAERHYEFPGLEEVEQALETLMHAEPALVSKLLRLPGAKESRYAHRLGGDDQAAHAASPGAEPPLPSGDTERQAVARLEGEVATLRQELDELRRQFLELKRQLE